MTIFAVNWVALLIGIAWSMALGMFWYSPKTFFMPWMHANGRKQEDYEGTNPVSPMVAGLIANAVVVYALGVFLKALGAEGPAQGALWGVFVALGFILAAEINHGSFRMTKPLAYFIDGGYRLLVLGVAGAVFAAF